MSRFLYSAFYLLFVVVTGLSMPGPAGAADHASNGRPTRDTEEDLSVQSNRKPARSVEPPKGATSFEVQGDLLVWVTRTVAQPAATAPGETIFKSKQNSKNSKRDKAKFKSQTQAKSKSERASARKNEPAARPPVVKDHIWLRHLAPDPDSPTPGAPLGTPRSYVGALSDEEILALPTSQDAPALEFRADSGVKQLAYLHATATGGRELVVYDLESKRSSIQISDELFPVDDELKLLGWSADNSKLWVELISMGRPMLAVIEKSEFQWQPIAPAALDTAAPVAATTPSAATTLAVTLPKLRWLSVESSFLGGSLQMDHGWILDAQSTPYRVLSVMNGVKTVIEPPPGENDKKWRNGKWANNDSLNYDVDGQTQSLPSGEIAARLAKALEKTSLLPPRGSSVPALSGAKDLLIPRTPHFTQVPGEKISLFSTAYEFARLSFEGIATSAAGLQREAVELLPRRHLNEAIKACVNLNAPASRSLCLQIATKIAVGQARIIGSHLSWRLSPTTKDATFLADFCQPGMEGDGLRLFRACVFDQDALANYAFAPGDHEVRTDSAKRSWFCEAAGQTRDPLPKEFYNFRDSICAKKNYLDVGVDNRICTARLFSDDSSGSGNPDLLPEALCRLFSPQDSNQELGAAYLSRFSKLTSAPALHRYLLNYAPLDEVAARSVIHALITWRDPEIVVILTGLLQQPTSHVSQRLALSGFGELRDPRTLPILIAYMESIYGETKPVQDLIHLIEKKP